MSRFSGPQGRGAMRKFRQDKKLQAEVRQEEYTTVQKQKRETEIKPES